MTRIEQDNNLLFTTKNKGLKPNWKQNGGYLFFSRIYNFFTNPYKKEKEEINILKYVSSLLENAPKPTNENISLSKQLTYMHRVVENTNARRRLERWSLRVIVWYLVIVGIVVFASYLHITGRTLLQIPNSIMIAILTTTTANIIGLGLIVLRGHFLAKENNEEDNKK